MIVCKDLARFYPPDTWALKPLNAEFEKGRSYAIYGKSGSGKTTWLKLLAGLETPSEGFVQIPEGTRISMVFQSDMLLEHLSAFDNIAYGIESRQKGWKEQVRETARLCACGNYLQQRTGTLSGGQRQRVALARALVKQPDLLLMDEPFAHMDPDLKYELLFSVKKLQKQLGFTLLFVSHDINEAINAADTILYLENGQLLQSGTYEELMNHPADTRVAAHFSYPGMNILPAENGFWGFYPDAVLPEGEGELSLETGSVSWKRQYRDAWLFETQCGSRLVRILWHQPDLPEKISIKKGSIFCFDAAGMSIQEPEFS